MELDFLQLDNKCSKSIVCMILLMEKSLHHLIWDTFFFSVFMRVVQTFQMVQDFFQHFTGLIQNSDIPRGCMFARSCSYRILYIYICHSFGRGIQPMFVSGTTWIIPMCFDIPSRELTYPTLGKGKSSSKSNFLGGYVSSLEGTCSWFFMSTCTHTHTF